MKLETQPFFCLGGLLDAITDDVNWVYDNFASWYEEYTLPLPSQTEPPSKLQAFLTSAWNLTTQSENSSFSPSHGLISSSATAKQSKKH